MVDVRDRGSPWWLWSWWPWLVEVAMVAESVGPIAQGMMIRRGCLGGRCRDGRSCDGSWSCGGCGGCRG